MGPLSVYAQKYGSQALLLFCPILYCRRHSSIHTCLSVERVDSGYGHLIGSSWYSYSLDALAAFLALCFLSEYMLI